MYRRRAGTVEVLLAHPGGPFWANKDDGAWSIPKGLFEENENPKAAALREFEEEIGCRVTNDPVELGRFKQPSGKMITAFAVEDDVDLAAFKSNVFSMEWPPKSGRLQEFPEVDRASWFSPSAALRKIIKGQRPIVHALIERLGIDPDTDES
jgi:predicted NUDIX family NTP pyrophosphohydrolase